MILIVRHKFSHYRRFELDLWGVCFTDSRAEKLKYSITFSDLVLLIRSAYFKFFYTLWHKRRLRRLARRRKFTYRLDVKPIQKRGRKFNARFLSIRLTRLYFLTFQDHQFRRMFRLARLMDGNFERNFFMLLEGRMVSILYRSNFVSNLFDAIKYVRAGFVVVDESIISSLNRLVIPGSVMTFGSVYRRRVRRFLQVRSSGRALLFNTPRFIFSSFFFI